MLAGEGQDQDEGFARLSGRDTLFALTLKSL